MGEKTLIAWTDHTWNLAWGCAKVSPGCANCYAAEKAASMGYDLWRNGQRRTFGETNWAKPVAWNKLAERTPGLLGEGFPHLIFSSSMADNFEDNPTIRGELKKLWPLIRSTPNLIWQIATKRPENIQANLPEDWGNGYENVWLGVSVENSQYSYRIDELRKIPATLRFISYEPALGPLDKVDLSDIGWLIYGGESGPKHRGHDIEWPRSMRDRCLSEGIPFFFKQSPARYTETGITLDGQLTRQFPTSKISPLRKLELF